MDTRVQVAGFDSRYDTESLGLAQDGSGIVVSAMFNRRVLKLVENIHLEDW